MKLGSSDVKFLRQRTQFSCMASSLCSALFAHGKDVTEEEVNKVLGARPLRGASWEELMGAAQYFGLRATLVIPSTVRQLKGWTDSGTPVIIAWNPEDRPWSHASVVFDVKEKEDGFYISVMDPNIPNPDKTVRECHEDFFYKKWSEKGPSYLIRRPACALTEEVTREGRQVLASNKGTGVSKAPHTRTVSPGTELRDLENKFGAREVLIRMSLIFGNNKLLGLLRKTKYFGPKDKGSAIDLIYSLCQKQGCSDLFRAVFSKLSKEDKADLMEALGGLKRSAGQQEKRMAKSREALQEDLVARYTEGKKLRGKAREEWEKKHPEVAENVENPPPKVKALMEKMEAKTKKTASSRRVAYQWMIQNLK